MTKETLDLSHDFLQLARTALAGRPQDLQLLIHRAAKRYRLTMPELADKLIALLQESPTRTSPLRKQAETPLPVDVDTRLHLLRIENGYLDSEPVFSNEMEAFLNQLLGERRNMEQLLRLGLHPTKSILFTGPPGVGKTLAARWIAYQLGRPLLVLDLAAVMSSFLGRTGNNIRYVLDYAKNTECVLLLDELDAIAKRRDDTSEIGELKRLVTVLLQEIDDWPSTGLLIAATNHPDLLDPAVWRRFEGILRFDNPLPAEIERQVDKLLGPYLPGSHKWGKILSFVFQGKSFSEIERQINLVRKIAVITNTPLAENIERLIGSNNDLTHDQRKELAWVLTESGVVSQRSAHELTGIARETIRNFKSTTGNNVDKKIKQHGKA